MAAKRTRDRYAPYKCPNCWEARVGSHPHNGCVLAALMTCIADRETLTKRQRNNIHATTNTDALWDALGPIIDALEGGLYRWRE